MRSAFGYRKNGCGKTNLLVSLYRIGSADAFRKYFPVGANNYDDISNYKITYDVNGSQVYYSHPNKGWNPHPRNINILKSFGYASSIYVSASRMRFDVHNPAQLRQQRIRKHSVSQDMMDAMNQILSTTKFNNLKYIQLTTKGRPGRLIRHNNKLYIIDGLNYSENTFSLGERFVLNMLDQLEEVQNNSLIVIDEIELALHPIAQIAFLNYLKSISVAKNLTVIIATHSVSLIKNCNSIYYLENNGGNVTVQHDCKPSYILSGLTNPIDNNYDKLFLVEDKMAYYCLQSMLKKHCQHIPQHLNYKIAFVGGWSEVMRFLKQMNNILPYRQGMVYAYLDYDAKQSLNKLEAQPNLNEDQQNDLNTYNEIINFVSFLHITPEIEIWDWLVNNEQLFIEKWRLKTNNALFQLQTSLSVIDNNHRNTRTSRSCKECFDSMVNQLESLPNLTKEECCRITVEIYYENEVFNRTIWQDMNQTLYSQLS